jgi:hypothetical protein
VIKLANIYSLTEFFGRCSDNEVRIDTFSGFLYGKFLAPAERRRCKFYMYLTIKSDHVITVIRNARAGGIADEIDSTVTAPNALACIIIMV